MLKFGLAQINTTVGALEENCLKIQEMLELSRKKGIDLVLFPELTLSGYPPQDLLEDKDFIDKNFEYLEKLAKNHPNSKAIIGFVEKNPIQGKRPFNAAAFISNGKIKNILRKCLLPTYDVFDETRYFEASQKAYIIDFDENIRLGITICEDIWYLKEKNYPFDPVAQQVEIGIDYLINISASPYEIGKGLQKEKLLRQKAIHYQVPILYLNLVGGNDELIFDGRSMIIGKDGKLEALAPDFEEILLEWSPKSKPKPIHYISQTEEESVFKALSLGISDYTRKCNFEKVLIGISGGIDSAITAALATHALGPQNVWGIAMPSRYSSPGSLTDAEALCKNLNIRHEVISIDCIFENYLNTLGPLFQNCKEDVTEENLQARIRGAILMALSNKFKSLVLTTGNKSEIAVGYCTLYGDTCGGFAVISDLPKTWVYRLAKYLNREKEVIPETIIQKPPSAELRPDQKDQDSLPDYDTLDAILSAYVEDRKTICEIVKMGYEKKLVKEIIRKVDLAEYKRKQLPPGFKITRKSFGMGRRMPVARGWF